MRLTRTILSGILAVAMAYTAAAATVDVGGIPMTYTRASIAFSQSPTATTEVAADVPAIQVFAVPSLTGGRVDKYVVNGTSFTRDNVNGTNLLCPLATDGTYLYAAQQGGLGQLHRTTDLDTWTRCNATQPINFLFVTRSGKLIGESGNTVKWSDDYGTTWHDPSPAPDFSTGINNKSEHWYGYFGQGWNIKEDDSGTIIANEYCSFDPATCGKIFRSTDDGHSWATVLDLATETVAPKHGHCIGWHRRTNTWLAWFGDGDNHQVWRSFDSGSTWTKWGSTERGSQFVDFVDRNHATKIFVCGDSPQQGLCEIDVTAASLEVADIRTCNTRWCGNSSSLLMDQAWGGAHVNGIAYFAQRCSGTTPTTARELSTSIDMLNWSTCELRTDISTTSSAGWERYAGYFGGRHHWITSGFAGHFSMLPATVETRRAVQLSSGHTNLFTADKSSFESTAVAEAWNTSAISRVSGGHNGSWCLKASTTAANSKVGGVISGYATGTVGQPYSARCRLKAVGIDHHSAQYAVCQLSNNSAPIGTGTLSFLNPADWSDVVIGTTTLTTNTTIRVQLSATAEAAGRCEWLTDDFQISAGDPTHWQVGGTALAASLLSGTTTAGTTLTHSTTVYPVCASWRQTSASKAYIWAYIVDASNYVEVYYLPSAKKFGVQRTVGGSAQTAVETAAVEFGDLTPIRLTLTSSASGIALGVAITSNTFTASDSAMTGLYSGAVTIKYADHAQANGWPCSVIVAGLGADADADRTLAKADQALLDVAAVREDILSISTEDAVLGETGLCHVPTAANTVAEVPVRTTAGTYPTTASTQASDVAAIESATLDTDGTDSTITLSLGVTATAHTGLVYTAGQSAQLATDQAAVSSKKAYIYPNANILSQNDGTLRASNIGTLAGTSNLTTSNLANGITIDNVTGVAALTAQDIADALTAYGANKIAPDNAGIAAAQEAISGLASMVSLGTGARSVALTVTDGTSAIPNATVRLTSGATTVVGITSASGLITFSIDDGTWAVSITKSGYTFTPTSLTITENTTHTYAMSIISVPASDPGMVTGYLYAYSDAGVVESGAAVDVQIRSTTGSGNAYDSAIRTETSNAQGLVAFANMHIGASYRMRRGIAGRWVEFTVPTTATSPYALPSIVGADTQ